MTFILSKNYIIASSSENTITLTGSGTSWLSSNPTFTISSGATITAQSITSNTQANLTINAGSSSAQLTITDPSTSTTQNLYIAVDIAQSKAASASSTYTGYPASNTTDGNTSTFWSSATSSGGWLQIDLGKDYLIFETRFEPFAGYENRVSNGTISWGDNSDGSSPVLSQSVGTVASGQNALAISNSGTNSRYIRMTQTNIDFSVREVRVYAYNPIVAATSYSLSTNSYSTTNNSSITLTIALPSNTTLSNSVIVTLNDNNGGGAFSSSTVTLSTNTSSATVSYTPSSAGTETISSTNNGSLSNPNSLSIVVSPAAISLNIIYDGNSLTAGVGGSQSYSVNCSASLVNAGYSVSSTNFGVSGQTTAQMISDANIQVDGAYNNTKNFNICVCWEGINDLYFGATVQQAYQNLVSYCLVRKAKGYKVVIGTLTPRQNAGTPTNQETNRLAVNVLIRANWTSFADAIADIGADVPMGVYATCTNTTYYNSSDLVHFTDIGYNIMSGIVSSAINQCLTGSKTNSNIFIF